MNAKEIRDLRSEIAKLTGRTPVSTNEMYLTRRLADLRSSPPAPRSPSDAPVISVSVSAAAREAIHAIAAAELLGVSELVRRAIGEYARRRGHPDLASAIEVGG